MAGFDRTLPLFDASVFLFIQEKSLIHILRKKIVLVDHTHHKNYVEKYIHVEKKESFLFESQTSLGNRLVMKESRNTSFKTVFYLASWRLIHFFLFFFSFSFRGRLLRTLRIQSFLQSLGCCFTVFKFQPKHFALLLTFLANFDKHFSNLF